jgi:hypothetical protein
LPIVAEQEMARPKYVSKTAEPQDDYQGPSKYASPFKPMGHQHTISTDPSLRGEPAPPERPAPQQPYYDNSGYEHSPVNDHQAGHYQSGFYQQTNSNEPPEYGFGDEEPPHEEQYVEVDLTDENEGDLQEASMFPEEFFDPPPFVSSNPEWFVKVGGRGSAPISLQSIRSLLRAGELTPDSFASHLNWEKTDYRVIASIPDMQVILRLEGLDR